MSVGAHAAQRHASLPLVIDFTGRVALMWLGVLGNAACPDRNTKGASCSITGRCTPAWDVPRATLETAPTPKPLRRTNPIENLNGLIAHYTGNVKRRGDGARPLRWNNDRDIATVRCRKYLQLGK